MTTNHLSETEIQQYVLAKASCEKEIVAHIEVCEGCQAKAATYQLLFAEIKEQPKPAFDFNLSELVLQQLPQAKPKFSFQKFFVYLVAFIAVSAIGIPGYIFWKNITYIFAGVSVFFIWIIIIFTVIIIAFQSIEMYKKYQRQMDVLNFN